MPVIKNVVTIQNWHGNDNINQEYLFLHIYTRVLNKWTVPHYCEKKFPKLCADTWYSISLYMKIENNASKICELRENLN